MNRRRDRHLVIAASTWTYSSCNLCDALRKIAAEDIKNVEVWANGVHLDPRSSNENSLSVKQALTQEVQPDCEFFSFADEETYGGKHAGGERRALNLT